MLLQETGIPDNVPYLLLGVGILFLILGGWVGSFFWRLRNLRRDITMLEQLAAEDAAETAAASGLQADTGDSAGTSDLARV